MKNNWQTTHPLVSDTGKSKLLLCKVQWGNEIFPVVAFWNGKEWIERNMKPVIGEVIGWQIIKL